MKKLFTAIQKNDHAAVSALLCNAPELIHCIHQSNPKKYDSQSLLQRIFPTLGSNPGLLHYRQILYCLSHQG